MKNLRETFLTLLMILGLTNCSTSTFTLLPDEEFNLKMGRQEIEKEDQIAYSALSFEESTKREYLLNLYVYNKSGEKILVDPKEVYFKAFDENRKLINKEKYFAVDPEEEINKIDSQIKNRDTNHDISTGLNIVFSLFDTIVDLSDDEDDNLEELAENAIIFTDNQINEEVSYNNDVENLKNQKNYWKNEVLRKTELDTTENIQGIFYLPIFSYAKYIKVYIPLEKVVHTYKFKQEVR